MKARYLPLAIALAAFAGPAGAAVTVTFTQPDRYTDVSRMREEETLKDLESYFQKMGRRYVPASQSLRIEVLDIDLAGDERYVRTGDRRVLRGDTDWPRLRLRYTVEGGGHAPESREVTLSDMNYLSKPIRGAESLAYEKRLIEEWFKEQFAARAAKR